MAYKKEYTNGSVTVVKNEKREYGVIDNNDNIVVPFGKYAWIDEFDQGLARVHTVGLTNYTKNIIGVIPDLDTFEEITGQEAIASYYNKERKEHPERFAKWGIINESGEEVLPLEYETIWNFKKKNRSSTWVEKEGLGWDVYFSDLKHTTIDIEDNQNINNEDESYGGHYGEYAGSYAQDVMGYDDDTINDAFDGDPDAYWNID